MGGRQVSRRRRNRFVERQYIGQLVDRQESLQPAPRPDVLAARDYLRHGQPLVPRPTLVRHSVSGRAAGLRP
jgi:hypothetical protein